MTLKQRRDKIAQARRELSKKVNSRGRIDRDLTACVEREKLLKLCWRLLPNPMVVVSARGAVYGAPLKRKRNLSAELGAL